MNDKSFPVEKKKEQKQAETSNGSLPFCNLDFTITAGFLFLSDLFLSNCRIELNISISEIICVHNNTK